MRTYRNIIKDNFENRFRKNPRYSLRAFARDLGVSVSRLSEVLSSKSGLSLNNAEKIAKNLDLSHKEKELFLNQVTLEHGRSKKSRTIAKKYVSEFNQNIDFLEIDLEHFKIISEWYHYAILDLIETSTFRKESEWIANRLGINKFQVEQALERLHKLKLIESKKGKLANTGKTVVTTTDVSSDAIKSFHRQILEKAIEAIDFQSIEERDITSITVPLDTALIKELKQKIKMFRRDTNNWIKARNVKAEDVYCLNLNLFRLTKKQRGEKL